MLTYGVLGGGTEGESSRSRSAGRSASKARRGSAPQRRESDEEEEEEEVAKVKEIPKQLRFDTAQMRRSKEMEARLAKQLIGYAYIDMLDESVSSPYTAMSWCVRLTHVFYAH